MYLNNVVAHGQNRELTAIDYFVQIDEGWWRGLCKNRYGLFPANYVQQQ